MKISRPVFLLLMVFGMDFPGLDLKAQDLPGGTNDGGRQSANSTPEFIENMKKLDHLSVQLIKQANHRLSKCSKDPSSLQNFMDLYDRLTVMDTLESFNRNKSAVRCESKIRKCIMTKQVRGTLKSMIENPMIELYLSTKYPNHERVKVEDLRNLIQ